MRIAIVFSLLLILAACGKKPENGEELSSPLQGVTVRVVVVDEPDLQRSLKTLQGEWETETGGSLDVIPLTKKDLQSNLPIEADCVIYDRELLGLLAEQGALAKLDQQVLSHEDLHWTDFLELLKNPGGAWGGTQVAIPLGTETWVLLYRKDLFEKHRKAPPRTWPELYELAEFFDSGELRANLKIPEGGKWYPLAEVSAGERLVDEFWIRSAAYATHPSNYSTMFSVQSMRPLIDSPPFIRALEEMVAATPFRAPREESNTLGQVLRTFFRGESAMAIAPVRDAETIGLNHPSGDFTIGFAEIPGGEETYNQERRKWEVLSKSITRSVPVISPVGLLVSLCEKSEQPAAGRAFLAWVTGDEWGPRITSSSRASWMFRRSQQSQLDRWAPSSVTAAERQSLAEVTLSALDRRAAFTIPLIPGWEKYSQALNAELAKAIQGEVSPQAALQEAAAKWRQLNQEFGFDVQRRYFRRGMQLPE